MSGSDDDGVDAATLVQDADGEAIDTVGEYIDIVTPGSSPDGVVLDEEVVSPPPADNNDAAAAQGKQDAKKMTKPKTFGGECIICLRHTASSCR